jgi:hypothetical protein
MRTSGQTEMTKLEYAFRSFAKAHKKKKEIRVWKSKTLKMFNKALCIDPKNR